MYTSVTYKPINKHIKNSLKKENILTRYKSNTKF